MENLYQERVEKNRIAHSEGSGVGEHAERDSLIVLDDVSGLADKSPSFVTFMTVCRKFGYSLLYVFHETVQSSPRWKDILSQTHIFCVFPSALDLVINYLMKFITRSGSGQGYVSRQQMWITNLVRALAKKSGYSCFCVDRRPHVFGAARYRSQVENPTVQYCYLNSSTLDKLFDTFTSRRLDQEDKIEFIIEKQVRETASGQLYELQTNKDGGADDKRTQTTEQRGSGRPDRIRRRGRQASYFVNRILEPSRNSSWLNVNPRVPSKDISQPPSKKKEVRKNRNGTSNYYTKTTQQGILAESSDG